MKNAVLAMQCGDAPFSPVAARFVSFLSFIGIQQIGIQFLSFFFYSLFHFEVSIFLSIIGIEKIFLFIFFVRVSSRSGEHVAPTISKSVEFYMEFYMEWISIRVW